MVCPMFSGAELPFPTVAVSVVVSSTQTPAQRIIPYLIGQSPVLLELGGNIMGRSAYFSAGRRRGDN